MKLPASAQIVDEEAFCGVKASRVVLPGRIRRIEARAFSNANLRQINLPEALEYIAPDAFSGCTGLVASVEMDSYAHQWCVDHNIAVRYTEKWSGSNASSLANPTITSDAQVALSWSGNNSAIYYSIFERVDGVDLLLTTVEGTSALLSGVSEGTHTFVVRSNTAANGSGILGEASNVATIDVSGAQFSGAPELTYSSEVEANGVRLTWNGNAASYEVIELGEGGVQTRVTTTTETTVTLTNVSAGIHTYAVRARFSNGTTALSGSRQIYVAGVPTSISLDASDLRLLPGNTRTLVPTIEPAGAFGAITWTSDNTGVATVQNGIITALTSGNATITATMGSVSASCTLQVMALLNSNTDGMWISNGVLKKYSGSASHVVIPDGVISIGDNAFKSCKSLITVDIPVGVKSIGEYAFYQCGNLASVQIPEGVKSIGKFAFSECESLSFVELPGTMNEIGNCAFEYCYSLTSIVLPDGIKTIAGLFNECVNLTSVVIPRSVTTIGSMAFSECESLESLEIPEGVKIIQNEAFTECTSLSSLVIPSSVERIGANAFAGCTNLSSIVMPDRMTSIGNDAFRSCINLTSIAIPNGVTTIEACTFENCLALNSVIIPYGVTGIGKTAFRNCPCLTSILIPDSVTSIGISAFASCTSLTSAVLPQALTRIESGAFAWCEKLASVVIPETVTSIGSAAFRGCNSLTSIVIPDGVETIETLTFCYNDESPVYVLIPASVRKLVRKYKTCDPFELARRMGMIIKFCYASFRAQSRTMLLETLANSTIVLPTIKVIFPET